MAPSSRCRSSLISRFPSHASPQHPSRLSSAHSRLRDDDGAATAEYAIVIMAAVSFAGLLVAIMRSGEVQSILTELVRRALTVG